MPAKSSVRVSNKSGGAKPRTVEVKMPSGPPEPSRDQIWADAAKPQRDDRVQRREGDILTMGQRRLMRQADREMAVVVEQRDNALRTIANMSRGMAQRAQEARENPKGRVSNTTLADILEGFLLTPTP